MDEKQSDTEVGKGKEGKEVEGKGKEGKEGKEVESEGKEVESEGSKTSTLDWLLYIGLGVCILVLFVMVLKLIFSGDSEVEAPIKQDITLFPGLFDEPIMLFERGNSLKDSENRKELKIIDSFIVDINNKISDIKMSLPCDESNRKIYDLAKTYSSLYPFADDRKKLNDTDIDMIIEEYDEMIKGCSDNGCEIVTTNRLNIKVDGSYKCNVFKDYDNTNNCKKSYLFNYLDNGVLKCPDLKDSKCEISGKPFIGDLFNNQDKYEVCLSNNPKITELEEQLKTSISRKDDLKESTNSSPSSYQIMFG